MNYIVLDLQHLNVQRVNNTISQLGAGMSSPRLVGLAVTLDKQIAFRYFKLMSLVGSVKGNKCNSSGGLEKRTVMEVTSTADRFGATTHT